MSAIIAGEFSPDKVTLEQVVKYYHEEAKAFSTYAIFSEIGFYKRLEFARDGRSRLTTSHGTNKPTQTTFVTWTGGIEAYNNAK